MFFNAFVELLYRCDILELSAQQFETSSCEPYENSSVTFDRSERSALEPGNDVMQISDVPAWMLINGEWILSVGW